MQEACIVYLNVNWFLATLQGLYSGHVIIKKGDHLFCLKVKIVADILGILCLLLSYRWLGVQLNPRFMGIDLKYVFSFLYNTNCQTLIPIQYENQAPNVLCELYL